MRKQHLLLAILMLFSLSIFSACKNSKETTGNGDGDQPAQFDEEELEQDRMKLAKLENNIRALTENTQCKEGYMCTALAFGSKPCGGPWEYIVFAGPPDEVGKIMVLVEDYNQKEASINKEYGLASDCMFVEEPEVKCVDGNCRSMQNNWGE